jgi:hypothetical protein
MVYFENVIRYNSTSGRGARFLILTSDQSLQLSAGA